jgi:hypothetical protein
MVWDEIIGREVVRYEVFEPWCMSQGAQIDGIAVFGALALQTRDAVLTLSSQLRFSRGAGGAHSAFGLCVSVMPVDAWALKRNGWKAQSAAVGARPLPWYAVPMNQHQDTPYLPIPLGRAVTDIAIRPQNKDAVSLRFEGHRAPVTFEYHNGFDGGVAWVGPKHSAPALISPFSPMGEFCWLHPAANIEIRHPLGIFKSAMFEDWPLAMRRAVFGNLEADNGVPLRTGKQLLGLPGFRAIYLDTVADLMQLRFDQHPALARRLAAMSSRVGPESEYADMVNARFLKRARLAEIVV